MPKIVSDLVDAYLFRRAGARIQFLVLRRRPDIPMGDTWQSIHGKVASNETAIEAARREIIASTGLIPTQMYTADFISQFYDHESDTIVLAPAFAAQVAPQSRLDVASHYSDYAWCDLEETTARLPLTTHRWAVRHIYDVIALGGDEASLYEI